MLATLTIFACLAHFYLDFFLRTLGIWLTIDGVGSICLRHRDLARYEQDSRLRLELFYRLVRICFGVALVLWGVP